MNRLHLIFAVSIFAGISGFGLYQSFQQVNGDDPSKSLVVQPIPENLYESHMAQENHAATVSEDLRKPLGTLVSVQQLLRQTDAALAAADIEFQSGEHSHSAAWAFAEEGYLTPDLPLNDAVISKAVVVFDHEQTDYPEPGGQVELPMLNGESVTADVKHAVVTPSGDYSWSGHLAGHGTDYPITMTYGETSAFSMITTPKGSYTMETVNGVGWLYKNPSELELSEPGSEHAIMLEQPI